MTAVPQDIPIVDIDTHFTEPQDLWQSRAPAKLKDTAPRVILDKDGRQQWVAGDFALGPPGFCVVRKDGQKSYGTLSLATFEEMSAAASFPDARLKTMDDLGLHAQVMYPNILGFAGSKMMGMKDDTLRNFCITAYNDAVADMQLAGNNRLFPQALLPFWDIDLAIAELQRAHDVLGLKGFTMTDAPEQWGMPYLHDPAWDRLWSIAEERKLPVNFHIGSGTTVPPWAGMSQSRMLASVSTMLFMNNVRCLVNLIFSGLLDRFPALNFVSVESGIGWLPFMLEACEYQMNENMIDGDGLQLRPREYFERQIYASFWFEKDSVKQTLAAIGDRNVMFETDFPHPTCLYPDVQGHVQTALGDLSETSQRRILYQTAAEVYNLPVTAHAN